MYEKELIGLAESGARYLVIGGIAVGLHGFVRATNDLDLMPDLSNENLDKIVHVLTSLGYSQRVPVALHELKDPAKRDYWHEKKNMKVFTFINPQQPLDTVDLMLFYPYDFDEWYSRKKIVLVQGREIPIASVRDMLTLKLKARRDRDIADIRALEELLEEES